MTKKVLQLEVDIYKMPEQLPDLKCKSGIYFLVSNGVIDYIGKSVSINNRLMGHHVFDRNKHDEVWVYPIHHTERYKQKTIEYQLIRALRPASNTHGVPKLPEYY